MKSLFYIIWGVTLFPVLNAAASKWMIQKYPYVFEPQKTTQLTILFKSWDYANMISGLLGTF